MAAANQTLSQELGQRYDGRVTQESKRGLDGASAHLQ